MDSKLLAFRLARPAEPTVGLIEPSYDPRSQTATWNGNGAAIASVYCTHKAKKNFSAMCNSYENYCVTFGGAGRYACD